MKMNPDNAYRILAQTLDAMVVRCGNAMLGDGRQLSTENAAVYESRHDDLYQKIISVPVLAGNAGNLCLFVMIEGVSKDKDWNEFNASFDVQVALSGALEEMSPFESELAIWVISIGKDAPPKREIVVKEADSLEQGMSDLVDLMVELIESDDFLKNLGRIYNQQVGM